MIHPDSRTLPWIQEVANKYKFTEVQLIEKSIRAFSLLKLLIDGMKRVRGFIHSEKYGLESAIVNAAKAAYLSKIIEEGEFTVNHFNPNDTTSLLDTVITVPLPTKLNRLKKTNVEAFYYWAEVQKLMHR